MPLFSWNAYCAIWAITWDHFVSSFKYTIEVEKSFLSSTDWLKVKVPDGFVVTLSLEFRIKQLQLISEFPGPPSLGLDHSPSPRCRSHTSPRPTLISQLGFHKQYWNKDQRKSGIPKFCKMLPQSWSQYYFKERQQDSQIGEAENVKLFEVTKDVHVETHGTNKAQKEITQRSHAEGKQFGENHIGGGERDSQPRS